uniref:Uncharacterized protein n=1 Tax=Cucumis melo TaxID=3656 RepID=A0A9I9EA52_CUCME
MTIFSGNSKSSQPWKPTISILLICRQNWLNFLQRVLSDGLPYKFNIRSSLTTPEALNVYNFTISLDDWHKRLGHPHLSIV